ncbi:MAG TPA: hypothetical protein VH277_04275 [Gemmatimonadaceae bacterium]|nr:hypothetical protein [Gemmatimonadaceae bacterium]
MTLRTFVDSAEEEWEAFDVVPRDQERRHYDRRASTEIADDADRRESDRRVTVGRASRIGGLQAGWLCFQRGDDRRRLSPIPEDWTRCSDEQLEEYCRAARPVRRAETKTPRD